MKIKNIFHRATDVEKQDKSLKKLKREKRGVERDIAKTSREIDKQNVRKKLAVKNGDRDALKEAIMARKRLERSRGQLRGNSRGLDEVASTVRNVKSQLIMDKSVDNAHKAMAKAIKNAGDTDKTMERLENLREQMENRNDQMEEMQDAFTLNAEIDAEMDEEYQALAAQMDDLTISPIQQRTAPVYENEDPIAEEN